MSSIGAGVLKRTCMRDRIRDVLVARILDGTYAAGTQLKELNLAREFNVSQTPIREALRELEGSGLVTSERFRGTRVRGADSAEMRESYELRTMIEVRSVKLAAPYSEKLLADFGEYLVEMEAAVNANDSERYERGHRNQQPGGCERSLEQHGPRDRQNGHTERQTHVTDTVVYLRETGNFRFANRQPTAIFFCDGHGGHHRTRRPAGHRR